MRQTKAYTFIFCIILSVVVALILSVASQTLKEKQKINIETDMKKNILAAVGVYKDNKCFDSEKKTFVEDVTVLKCYENNIKSFIVDYQGKIKKGDTVPETISSEKEMGKPENQRNYPVFALIIKDKIESYGLPVSGKGLWSSIYGYLAISKDLNTVKGLTFYKHGETPGLGAEIETEWYQKNYVGKKIFNKKNELVSVTAVKGKVSPNSPNIDHEVDGISGATLTVVGVNKLLLKSLKLYEPYLKMLRKEIK